MSAWLLLAAVLKIGSCFHESPKFLIVSSPGTHKVAYSVITTGFPKQYQMYELIGTGLTNPQGVAVDDYRHKLYVADPGLLKLVYYDLTVKGDVLRVGSQKTAAASVEVRWVAVDSVGNVFFSVEPYHRIMKLSTEAVEKGSTTAATVYDGAYSSHVSSPGGVAVDNFFVYWTNKEGGTQVGSVVRGTERIEPQNFNANETDNAKVLSRNAVKTYGLCSSAHGILYYTDETANLYGLKPSGAETDLPVTVSAGFVQPRGCAFDGDSTVFVADKYLNAVYGFPARSSQPRAGVQMLKASDLEGAFGVAVFQSTHQVLA